MANATLVWSAESTATLDDERGTLTRAAYEAHLVAMVAGVDRSYPGYRYAVERSLLNLYRENTAWRFPLFGTEFGHVLSTGDTADGFVATVCLQSSGIARLIDDGYFRTIGPGYRTQIEFTKVLSPEPMAVDGESRSTTANRDNSDDVMATSLAPPGTWSAPLDDHFGGWRVSIGGVIDDQDGICETWGRRVVPDAPVIPEEVTVDVPPETLPAFPGWPRGS
ncbi:hypothetical protein [Millisia brevis]|uniref:hypothetical protein n=1 Tax=Millisia brevis TaxID=264148 RepID=UPI00082E253B|nr:hypothetical protein [Millisia brevis]